MKRLLAASSLALALGACNDQYGASNRSLSPIPQKTLALMSEKGMGKSDPILVRLYKKESELEVWKQIGGGDYALLKTFPICRWSGQLGPKTREGDRQAPEGFYTVNPGQMNPNSAFYLSFDTGYPNAFDRAHGRTGSHLMVHGNCSSRGCYAMTDEGISEVYALARESFSAGQRGFQVQAYPFRMTPTNFARYRHDPNMPFWKNLKQGHDHFEVTKREPKVAVCAGRYAFDTIGDRGECKPDPTLAPAVAQRDEQDRRDIAELIVKGTPSVRLVYADGGGHESFRAAMPTIVTDSGSNFALLDARSRRNLGDVSRPDALAQGPREIAMEGLDRPGTKAKPSTALAAMATARAGDHVSKVAGRDRSNDDKLGPDTASVQLAARTLQAAPAKAGTGKSGQIVLASADPDEPMSGPPPSDKPLYDRVKSGVVGAKAEPKTVKADRPKPVAEVPATTAAPASPPVRRPVAPPSNAAKPQVAKVAPLSAPASTLTARPKLSRTEAPIRQAETKLVPGAATTGPVTSGFARN